MSLFIRQFAIAFFATPFLFGFQALSIAADVAAGKAKAEQCSACHGPNGNSVNPEIPALAGQPALMISNMLFYYREGIRKNEIMRAMAANLSNKEMKDVAAFYSTQVRENASYQSKVENVQKGALLTEKYNCTQCHGPQLQGVQHIPRIAGQQPDYLLTQLKGFKAMTREDMDGNMTSAFSVVKYEEIEPIADYLAGLRIP